MIYEQPLNEQIRLCLRLEYLFSQADHYVTGESIWDSHQALRIILEILQVIDRPDLKNKICQTLNQYVQALIKLENLQDIDKEKLISTLEEIESLIDHLHSSPKKIGQDLRENEFLNAIQQRLYTPAGTCSFSLPSYYLWLQQEKKIRHQQLSDWFQHLTQLQKIVAIILKIIRESSSFKTVQAIGGFYQNNLDSNIAYQMIRINSASNKIFPEISVGRYRLAIHFFTLDITGRAAQTPHDIPFEIACCKM